MTTVVAPAGYGKTALITEWTSTAYVRARRFAAIAIDAADNDVGRLARHLVGAAQRLGAQPDPGLGALLRDELRAAPTALPDGFLQALLTALDEVPQRGVLVIEDVHVLADRAVRDVLAYLVEALPPTVHLVLTSRSSIGLATLHRLRTSGELAEIDLADLAFTPEEARRLIAGTVDQRLSGSEVDVLVQRTEGWIAGLQLAVASLRTAPDGESLPREFTGSDRKVADFLLHEVLERQPDDVRSFLLDSCPLDVLSAELCEALTGRTDSAAILRRLEADGGFLKSIDDGEHYRFHALFAEFLRGEIRQEAPQRLAAGHRTAANWYARTGDLASAIEYALRARDYRLAGDLLMRIVSSDDRYGYDLKLRRWFEALPGEVLADHPKLAVRRAWMYAHSGQPADALRWCERADEAAGAAGADDALAESACIRTFAYWMLGNFERTVAWSGRARALLDAREPDHRHRDAFARLGMMEATSDAYLALGRHDEAHAVLRCGLTRIREDGNPFAAVSFPGKLAVVLAELGMPDRAREHADLSLRRAEEFGLMDQPPAADARVALGELLWEHDDLGAAEDQLRAAADICLRAQRKWMQARALLGLARCLFSQHRRAEAFSVLDGVADVDPWGAAPDFLLAQIAELQVRLRLRSGELPGARHWLAKLADHGGRPSILDELRVRVELADGDCRLARAQAESLADAGGRSLRTRIEVQLLAAQACDRTGDRPAAVRRMARAVALGEPARVVRTLVEGGGKLLAVTLRSFPADVCVPDPDYVRTIDHAMRRNLADVSRLTRPPRSTTLTEPLSDAELGILRYLPTDLTYAEIAANRYVSVNTVKSQLKSIYRKLEVTSRIAAIERCRELRLLGD